MTKKEKIENKKVKPRILHRIWKIFSTQENIVILKIKFLMQQILSYAQKMIHSPLKT